AEAERPAQVHARALKSRFGADESFHGSNGHLASHGIIARSRKWAWLRNTSAALKPTAPGGHGAVQNLTPAPKGLHKGRNWVCATPFGVEEPGAYSPQG